VGVRLLLDEDVPVQFVGPLPHLLKGHEVTHVNDLRWKRKKDRYLLPDAARRGFHAILTNDLGQLDDPDECQKIRISRLHHIRYHQRTTGRSGGLNGLALAMAAVFAAIRAIMEELDAASGQRLVEVKQLSPHRVGFELIDPQITPPPYWQ
jgi:hypothetical protein